MSNAEQAWKKAWDECLKKAAEGDYQVDHGSFMDGYKAGRADAWQLPEVRADELEEGKWYWSWGLDPADNPRPMKVDGPSMTNCVIWESQNYFTSFRGPLPLGDA